MSTTFRKVLNKVLSNISEDEVSASVTELTDTYHKLVRNFVNHFLSEVQDAHNWSTMRKTCTATITSGNNYSSNFQYAGADITTASRLGRQNMPIEGYILPLMYDVTGNSYRLHEMDLKEVVNRATVSTSGSATLSHFALDPAANAVVARIPYAITGSRSLQGEFYVPHDDFVGDSTDIDTVLNLPKRAVDAVELGATWYAQDERGEELGVNGMFSENRYNKALDAAIMRDDAEGSGDDYMMVPT